MNTSKKTGTIVGILLLTAIVAGILYVALTEPILGASDYLIRISTSENQVIMGALLQFIMAVACAGIAIWLYPVLRKHNETLALGSVSFRVIEAILFIIASVGLLSLLTLSQEYVKAGALDAAYAQTLGALILAARARFITGLGAIAFCLGALMYYHIFYQSKLIPRWLAGWGFFAVALHLTAGLLIVFGIEPFSTIILLLNLPIISQEMVMAIWLIVKGFDFSAIAFEPAKKMQLET